MRYLIKTKLNKCPICGRELRHSEDWLDFIRCEEYDYCINCNYHSGYAYGYYELSFSKYNFGWSYLTSTNNMINLDRKIQHKMFQVRRNWKKEESINHINKTIKNNKKYLTFIKIYVIIDVT